MRVTPEGRYQEREMAIRQCLWLLEEGEMTQEELGQVLRMKPSDVGEILNNWEKRPNTPTGLFAAAVGLYYTHEANGPPEPPPIHPYVGRRGRRRQKETAETPSPVSLSQLLAFGAGMMTEENDDDSAAETWGMGRTKNTT